MLKVTGTTEAVRYIHMGWMLALVAGGVTWLVTETVLTFSGRHRESMEGFISVFAAVALFYVGYWLHTRTEAKRCQAFIKKKSSTVFSERKSSGSLASLSSPCIERRSKWCCFTKRSGYRMKTAVER